VIPPGRGNGGAALVSMLYLSTHTFFVYYKDLLLVAALVDSPGTGASVAPHYY